MLIQAGISYDFKPHEGFQEFRYERAIQVGRGKESSWSRSTEKVYCESEAQFKSLIKHWNRQSNGVRTYKALT
jgi:hypothetical protein